MSGADQNAPLLSRLAEAFQRPEHQPVGKKICTRDGKPLEVVVFADSPEQGWFGAVSLGLSALPRPSGTERFELLLFMNTNDFAPWGDFLGDLVAAEQALQLRPRALGALSCPDLGVVGFLTAPPHWAQLRKGSLTRDGNRIRLLQVYPLLSGGEVAAARRVGAQSFLRSAWETDPNLIFNPKRLPFESPRKWDDDCGDVLLHEWPKLD